MRADKKCWSDKPPTKPGWYWFWCFPPHDPRPVEYAEGPVGLVAMEESERPPNEVHRGWWLPLTMPKTPEAK